MAVIDPSAVWDFAREVVGGARRDRGRTLATVTRIDADGTTWVTTGDGGEAPAASAAAGVSVGDTVSLEWDGASMGIRSNVTNPSPAGSVVRRAIERTRSVADAAQRVADAVNQHFFADTSGIHVTEATQDDWNTNHEGANVLINSVGQLFRDGLNNLLTLTTEGNARALTVWDGLGNAAENIRAVIGETIQLGSTASGNYVTIDGNGMGVTKGGSNVASFGTTARIGKSNGTRVVVGASSVKIIPNNKTANALTFEADDDYAQILYGNNYLNIGGVLFNYAYDLEAGTMWVSQGLHVGGSSTAGNPKFQVDASGLVNAGRKVVAAGNEMVALAASASSGSTNRGLWDETGGAWIIYRSTGGSIVLGNSVTDTLYKRTATCTVNTTNATIANSVNYCWNNGACCSIAIGINLKASMADANLREVATAPSGYRPPHTFYGSAYVTGPSVNLQTRIDENGKIYVNNRSGSTVNTSANIYLSFTFAP